MTSITVYGPAVSPFVRRVLAVLYEKGIEDFKVVPVDSLKGENKQPEYLEKQPFGKIPVIEDDGHYLFESRAIMRYIAEKYADQGPNLLGKDLMERALVNQWVDVEGHSYSQQVIPIIVQCVFRAYLKRGGPDQEKVAEAKTKLSPILDVYEKHLEGRQYLVGDTFTIADLTHLPFTELLPAAGHWDLFTSRPNLLAWWERISSRPAWKKVQELDPHKFN
nr:glutathione-S transferase [Closterium ehrenbergii]